jgi:hypothetical protein
MEVIESLQRRLHWMALEHFYLSDYVKADIKRAEVVTLFGLVKGLITAPNKHQGGCLMQSGYSIHIQIGG